MLLSQAFTCKTNLDCDHFHQAGFRSAFLVLGSFLEGHFRIPALALQQVGTWVPSSPLDPSPVLGLARKSKYPAYSGARISDSRGQGGGAKSQMILGLQVSNPGTLLFPRGHFTQHVSDGLESVQIACCVFQSRVLRGRDYFSLLQAPIRNAGAKPQRRQGISLKLLGAVAASPKPTALCDCRGVGLVGLGVI